MPFFEQVAMKKDHYVYAGLILGCAAIGVSCGVTSGPQAEASGPVTGAAVASQSRPDGRAVMQYLIDDAMDRLLWIPHIQEGKIVNGRPSTPELLSFLLDDYRKLTQDKEVMSVQYFVTAGVAPGTKTVMDTDQFRAGNLPVATYTFVVGEEIDTKRAATVTTLVQKMDGVHTSHRRLAWEKDYWREINQDLPGVPPLKPKSIK